MSKWRLGILGGMGPLATVDLMQKLLMATGATSDQAQIPVIAWNVPQIPDRQKALAELGESPLPAMKEGIRALNAVGASQIVIPCNTAHHWYNALAAESAAPVLHIVDLTVDAIAAVPRRPRAVGLIATQGTLQTRQYQDRLKVLGINVIEPTSAELADLFVPGCYAVKQNRLEQGGQFLSVLADNLVARGAEQLILACTEVPLALEAVGKRNAWPAIDPSEVLAKRCADDWHRQAERIEQGRGIR